LRTLNRGAQIVITGRHADAALARGPTIHEFGWRSDDWNLLAAGIVGGHAIECGTQATGGNCQMDWETIPDLAGIGYPILEAEPDGTFVITKHEGTGGRVSIAGVTEQLLYEIGDPRAYLTPDCTAASPRYVWKTRGRIAFVCTEFRAVLRRTATRYPSATQPGSNLPARWPMRGPMR